MGTPERWVIHCSRCNALRDRDACIRSIHRNMSGATMERGDGMLLRHVSLIPGDESWYEVGNLPLALRLPPAQFETLWSLHP